MSLQRNSPVNIRGWATVGEKVKFGINKQSVETITGPDAKWQVIFPAQKAGGPFDMDS
jgi:sialate O-acetylesterase